MDNSLKLLTQQLHVCANTPNAEAINRQLTQWLAGISAEYSAALISFAQQPSWLEQFQKVVACSQFALTQITGAQHVALLNLISPSLNDQWQAADYQQALSQFITLPCDEKALDKGLRLWRNAMMVRSIWRDLNRLAPTLKITQELTHLADVAVNFTLNYHYNDLCTLRGTPQNEQGVPMPMLVLGMGKLGAFELNLSSDIDLIFAYPESGQTVAKPPSVNSVSHHEFFTQLGQKLIKSLDAQTVEGFVFRVDMRLRPYGQSGALASNFDSLEHYYLTQGRDWERYAMVKARIMACCAGDTNACYNNEQQELMALLRSFTYRKYVDFSAIEALRDLKIRIRQEVKRRRLKGNVKLGEGGIREVEFIVQAQQLIRGGRDSQLQTPSIMQALSSLVSLGAMPNASAEQLRQSYCFLRDTEHAIQAWQDKQTQDIPQEPAAQWALAKALGFDDWSRFEAILKQHMAYVSDQFSHIIATPCEGQNPSTQHRWQSLWHETDQTQIQQQLEQAGFDNPKQSAQILHTLHHAPQVLAVDKTGGERLNTFMPLLLSSLSERSHSSVTLQRLQPLILSIVRRSAYVLLLIENAGALEQLVILSEASPQIPERLAQYPALLDELLSPSNLYQIPNKTELTAELTQTILRIAEDDLEQQMEALRYFRHSHGLKVAACEVTGKLPLMQVSDYLTELAEVILSYALNLAWQEMCRKHGLPNGQSEPNFIVVGYGKFGGIELGHASDLDLVFIHNAQAQQYTQVSEGQRPLDNHTFYTRMAQKLILLLDTKMPSGTLYEVDMRLRPSGNSGLLVSTLKAFSHYQHNEAWTWEHQALVRTRVVAGDRALAQQFAEVRQAVICQPRDSAKLKHDVTEMRQKMRSQLGSKTKDAQAGQFHIKQDAGGIVDIEFIVQYLVLANAHKHPQLVKYSDNIRILEAIGECGLLSEVQITALIESYKTLRSHTHKLALQHNNNQQNHKVDGAEFEGLRHIVLEIWRVLFE